MEVILKSTKHRVKKPVMRDHYWYDPETRKRLHGRGGRMIFVYDTTRKKSIPQIVEAEEWVYESNFDDIMEWIEDSSYVDSVSHVAKGISVSFETSASTFSGLEDELRYNNIMYDYDEADLRRETTDSREKKRWQNSQSKWQIRHHH